MDLQDVQQVLAARNRPASGPLDPRDLDHDGQITALDARRLVLACDRPGCAACPAPAPAAGTTWQVLYVHPDHLGTAQVLTDAQQQVVWQAQYRPFGETTLTTAQITQPLRFPGQYFDSETGLHYNYFRDYDPSTGRYIESDPIGLRSGLNIYTYVGSNPLSWVDLLGLYTEITIWEPVGFGASSFGHVSGNVNGRNYSFGQGGWDTKYPSARDYAERQQQFRSGTGVILNLTPQQEREFEQCLQNSQGSYDEITDNCGTPFKDCLRWIGIDIGYPLFPADIGNNLLDCKCYGGSKFYDGPDRSWDKGYFDAPWAR